MRFHWLGTALSIALLGGALLAADSAEAATRRYYDTQRSGGECSRYFARHERLQAIPVHLLSAIALTESGRYSAAAGRRVPWPWTINADGKGYYFNTQKDAVQAAAYLLRHGANNIDVGCMQVSLMAHPNAFRTLYQAFDPRYNVAYAARFLREKFEEAGSWNTAIAYYHSKTPGKGKPYANSVLGAWRGEINRLSGRAPARTASLYAPDAVSKESRMLTAAAQQEQELPVIPTKREPQMKVYTIKDFEQEADAGAAAIAAPKRKEHENGVTVVRLSDSVTEKKSAPAPKEQQFAKEDETSKQYRMVFSY
ncbi:MAG: lytic transglycosylase domain-containing protein [Alphaproteobacteria bacterium]|nr:lytic transglycosylase domain-containing protein [Alphaproteobacteria bacterium]